MELTRYDECCQLNGLHSISHYDGGYDEKKGTYSCWLVNAKGKWNFKYVEIGGTWMQNPNVWRVAKSAEILCIWTMFGWWILYKADLREYEVQDSYRYLS